MSHGPEQEQLPPGVPAATEAPRAPRLLPPPFWIISILLCVTIASFIPIVLAVRGRTNKSSEPRIHLFQDMGSQPKYREQQTSEIFADGRADRSRVPGTVSRGNLELSDHYYRGYKIEKRANGKEEVVFFQGFPSEVKLTESFVQRGRQRFEIFCAPCHGYDGYAMGTVVKRSIDLNSRLLASNLHDDQFRQRQEGHIYNTINVGIRSMPGHGGQIPVEDRWAIVAYVRALQLSQNAPAPK